MNFASAVCQGLIMRFIQPKIQFVQDIVTCLVVFLTYRFVFVSFSLDDLRIAATADTKLSSALQMKDIKIAEMEQRYCSQNN